MRRGAAALPATLRRNLRRSARLAWWTITFQLPHRLREYIEARRHLRHLALTSPAASPAQTPANEATQPVTVKPPSASALLPPKKGPRVLMIDSVWPQPDRDSGSIDAMNYIRLFRKLGYQVLFAAGESDDNEYRSKLELEK